MVIIKSQFKNQQGTNAASLKTKASNHEMNQWLPSGRPTSKLFLMKTSSRNRRKGPPDSDPEDQ